MGIKSPEPDQHGLSGGAPRSADGSAHANGPVEGGGDWLRSILEGSMEVLTIVDPDGTLRYASPAFERLFGYDLQEILGTNLLNYVHPDDVPQVRKETQKALVEASVSRNTVVYRLRHRDGSWRRVASVGTYLLEG